MEGRGRRRKERTHRNRTVHVLDVSLFDQDLLSFRTELLDFLFRYRLASFELSDLSVRRKREGRRGRRSSEIELTFGDLSGALERQSEDLRTCQGRSSFQLRTEVGRGRRRVWMGRRKLVPERGGPRRRRGEGDPETRKGGA